MKIISIVLTAALFLTQDATAFAPGPSNGVKSTATSMSMSSEDASEASTTLSRRNALANAVGTVAAAALPLLFANPSPANAAGAEAFIGTFSDPINHPGGKRTIRLLNEKVGDYQLAEVLGGGGIGEPKSYVLPAAVIGDRTIVIDFSPKGGPKDFVGVLNGGDIKFLKDGNRWPRLNE